jgi:translocation and assembly module TamB
MRWLFALLIACLPLAAIAQDAGDDRGFLTRLIEDNLSSVGRSVRIEGFAGALLSRATFTRLTIADDQGVWITITDGAIQWNRRALLSGRIEIDEMTVAAVDLPRAPAPEPRGATVAREFRLPDLPVAVRIGTLRADRVSLGASLLGEDVVLRLAGGMALEGGAGQGQISVARVDGRAGSVDLTASYSNATRALSFDLLAREGPGGIAARLIGLPGEPAAELALAGSGQPDAFTADIALRTDGVPRLTGRATIGAAAAATPGAAPDRVFSADLSGDLAPLFLPAYRDFFGEALRLTVDGARRGDGRLTLDTLSLSARAVDVTGSLVLLPGGLPERADLRLRLGLPDGAPVVLPLPGVPTSVAAGDLVLGLDAVAGEGWSLRGTLDGLSRPEIDIAALRLDGSGRIVRAGAPGVTQPRVSGLLRFAATGIAPADPGLDAAIRPAITGETRFSTTAGAPLQLTGLRVTGEGFGLTGSGTVGGIGAGLTITGQAEAVLADIGRLSMLAGRDLGGGATIRLSGSGSPLTRAFDLEATATGRDLRFDQAELDRLLAGTATITASALRNATGTTIRALQVKAATLAADLSGRIAPGEADLTGRFDFADLSVLGPAYRGRLAAQATLTEAAGTRRLQATGAGRDLRVGNATVDRIIAGRTDLEIDAESGGGTLRIGTFRLESPNAALRATAGSADPSAVRLEARLADMAILAPGFPGPLTLTGTARPAPGAYALDLNATGPGATTARIAGTVASGMDRVDLTLAGSLQSAIFNPFLEPRNISGPISFALTMNGRPSLAALSGRVALTGGRLVAPTFGLALTGLTANAVISGGQAQIEASGMLRNGGGVTAAGRVALAAPRRADLTIDLAQAQLRDPDLYDTRVTGQLRLTGALPDAARLAGTLTMDETEIRVPTNGLGGQALLTGIIHEREAPPSRETRRRAGLTGAGSGAAPADSGDGVALDITLTQPGRLFVRGRGLDAELGGALRLTGTSDAIVPAGGFTLIRGRLDLLGRRFAITEGRVQLEGSLIPQLYFAATSSNDGISATMVIEGPSDAPEVRFASTPALPEEEIVARLLFGRGLTTLSAFQAAQLASAVATLSGRGGGGLVERLRRSFGLDDFDVQAQGDGTLALRAGKYLTENAYSEIAIGAEGRTEITLNLDVSDAVTVRGTLGSDGATGLGVFYERDY